MADRNNGKSTDTAESMESNNDPSNLESFISTQIQQQEKISKESDNLDTEKRDNFIARALSESKRMNQEIEKSKEKRDRLHAELGEGRMTEWRNEHSAEVLTAQQTSLVNQSFQNSAT